MNDRNRFRVWCLENNEWEKGVWLDSNGALFLRTPVGFMRLKSETHIIERCTGKLDKKGSLVFSGDIVTNGIFKAVIAEYDSGGWGLRDIDKTVVGHIDERFICHLEIIGNVHEVER